MGRASARPSRVNARCMVLMMSPRSPSSRKAVSALGDRLQRPTSTSVARPMRSSLRARWISRARFCRRLSQHVPVWPQVGELVAAALLGDQHAVQPREAIGIDLPLQATRNLLLGLPAELPGDDLARPLPDAVGDVVAGDVEGLAVVGHAADDDVGVGMAGVVVIDRDPIELRAEIGFHLLHQIARGGAGIGELDAVLGRHDEAELVTVLAAAFDERATIFHIPFGRIDLALLAVLRHAVSLEIAQVSVDRLGADESAAARRPTLGVELHDPGLDRDAPRPRTNPTIPAPGAPILQRRRDRCAAATRIEPAASLPGRRSGGTDCRRPGG